MKRLKIASWSASSERAYLTVEAMLSHVISLVFRNHFAGSNGSSANDYKPFTKKAEYWKKKKREAVAWVTPTVFLQGFEITRTPDDVWKTSWQKCESVYRDSETWSSTLVSRLTWGKCGKQTLLMWFLLYVSESFHVGAIEPNSMAEWRTQVVWNVFEEASAALFNDA